MKANAPLWIVSLGQGGGDAAAVGGPGAPTITNPDGGSVITFTAGEDGAAGPTLGYGAFIEPEGPTLTVIVDDPSVGGEVLIENSEPYTDYVVTVYGVNVAGRGKSSQTNPFQLNYNIAEFTGAVTVADVDDYNGTKQKWKVATITGAATMTVTDNPADFHVFLVGGGGSGGNGCHYNSCGGRGGSGLNVDEQVKPGLGVFTFSRGGGGARVGGCAIGGPCACAGGSGGGASWMKNEAGDLLHNAGGGPGGPGGPGGSGNNAPNKPNYTYTSNVAGAGDANYGNNGGAGSCDYGAGSSGGGVGTVIVAWQVGQTDARRVAQVRANRDAEQQALEDALALAFLQGEAAHQDSRADERVVSDDEHAAAEAAMDAAIEAAAADDKPKRTRKKS